jgi:hypothetical protein
MSGEGGYRLACWRAGFLGKGEADPYRRIQALIRFRSAEARGVQAIMEEIRDMLMDHAAERILAMTDQEILTAAAAEGLDIDFEVEKLSAIIELALQRFTRAERMKAGDPFGIAGPHERYPPTAQAPPRTAGAVCSGAISGSQASVS